MFYLNDKDIITMTESAARLGFTRRTVQRMIKRGDLPTYTRISGPRSEPVTRRRWFNMAMAKIVADLNLPYENAEAA